MPTSGFTGPAVHPTLQNMVWMRRTSLGCLALASAGLVGLTLPVGGCSGEAVTEPVAEVPPEPEPIRCSVELRSFVVAGRGRHLFLFIDCPEPHDALDGRIEYTQALHRTDYVPPSDPDRANRIARMSTDGIVRPPFGQIPDNRLEAVWEVPLETARCLQRDRMFEARYVLIGTNSTSGLRAAMAACDCELPEHIVQGGGWLGTFPGVDQPAGAEIPAEAWPAHGIPTGPRHVGDGAE